MMELIDPVTKWWNVPPVHVVFNEEEANIICKISLSLVPANDQLIWRSTSHREFSVRSAYHMEKEIQAMRSCGGVQTTIGELSVEDDLDSENSKCSKNVPRERMQ